MEPRTTLPVVFLERYIALLEEARLPEYML